MGRPTPLPECWKHPGHQSLAVTLSHTASGQWPELSGTLHSTQEWMLPPGKLEAQVLGNGWVGELMLVSPGLPPPGHLGAVPVGTQCAHLCGSGAVWPSWGPQEALSHQAVPHCQLHQSHLE